MLSLALVVTLIAGMVPEMRAKAAEGENSGWIQVTEDNKNDLDTKVAVLDNLSQTTYDKFVFNAELAHRDIKSSKKGYYILGKRMENIYAFMVRALKFVLRLLIL